MRRILGTVIPAKAGIHVFYKLFHMDPGLRRDDSSRRLRGNDNCRGLFKKLIRILLLLPIRLYQYVISPFLPRACRFEPSCSNYAHEAITRHGACAGGWLTLKRLARCHPWGGSGHDPVP